MDPCPVCRSTTAREAWRYRAHEIVACPECGLEFVHPLRAATADYYKTLYAGRAADAVSGECGGHRRYGSLLTPLLRCVGADQRRVLDIGCGPGYVLSLLKARGFACTGIDFNPEVVQQANDRFQVNAHVGRIEDLGAFQGEFDVVLLVHVLEHVDDPMTLLGHCRRLLARGGLLFLDLPNRTRFALNRSLTRGELDEAEYPPHHVTFWSAPTLSRALTGAGFSVLACRPRRFGQEGQVGFFVENHLRIRQPVLRATLERVLRTAGAVAGLQSEFLYAVARRTQP
jgi:2-polyprenyl-3-methyl-5-hydroxy-6-metoxy-1,4-benzoquinol methylase